MWLQRNSTLIVQLKRYTYDANGRTYDKIQENINCPKSLTMPSGSTFTLSSIVNHIGSQPSEGHYNILIYDKIGDCYVLLDDSEITVDVEMNSEINGLCYIVIYTKDD